ncbi:MULTISPECIES: acyltransferase [unclassified Microbacterium]|uniref:acyltransferase family protein n=1 Tax=unclassified Microbacterium TaxID=2609290 RepID=UPI00214BC85B|nr:MULTISPECIES: acyltransferase [unclassified Microbacterium]MCR2808913.1 acyltransferase [Microbacterium sp. zg.B185]WIM18668.1 acyltransferase [Microbacterium sp. zg-B185]
MSSTPRELDLAAQPSWGRRLAGIEGIRGIAALLVVAHHTTRYLTDGRSAVGGVFSLTEMAQHGLTVFFVLSGFLLYRPFVYSLIAGRRAPTIGGYLRNRMLRILPAYIVIFLLANFVLQTLLTENALTATLNGNPPPVGMITDPWTFVANLSLLQSFFPGTIMTGIGPAWSLGAELLFYLLLPALFGLGSFLVARGWKPVQAALAPVWLMVIVGVVTSVIVLVLVAGQPPTAQLEALWGSTWLAVLDRSVLAQAELFGFGMGIAALVVWLEQRGVVRTRSWMRYGGLALGLVFAFVGARYGGPIATTLVGVSAAAVVFVVLPGRADHTANAAARVLEWLPLRYLGLISYSVYLWHEPVAWWVRAHVPHDSTSVSGWAMSLAMVTAISVALASLTYFFVERPAMRRKSRTDRTTPRPAGPGEGVPAAR